MGYTLITPASAEPISLTQAKTHLRVDISDDDALITMLITAARQYAEQITARSFITQAWRYTADSFPGGLGCFLERGDGVGASLGANAFQLEKGPVQSIDSITYVAMDGTTQTMPATDYVADLTGALARVSPKFGKIWPVTLPQIGAVAVNYTAGYGSSSVAVPAGLTQWMLLRIGALYENREEFLTGRGIVCTPLEFVDSLLNAYRVWRA